MKKESETTMSKVQRLYVVYGELFAPYSVYHGAGGDGTILGSFREKDYGHLFEFSVNTFDDQPEYPHLVWVRDGLRYAVVKKTVA